MKTAVTTETIFSFGENWKSYAKMIDENRISLASKDIISWLGEDMVKDKTILDIGCGSGIHSLAFLRLNAARVVSFDVDPKSVEATVSLWGRSGFPPNWNIFQGSILDQSILELLKKGRYDIVYSWGVLHHTGAMWDAVEKSSQLVREGGLYWIALYTKGPNYSRDLALKRQFNTATKLGKRFMVAEYLLRRMRKQIRVQEKTGLLVRGQLWSALTKASSILNRDQQRPRGMTVYHDAVDWLGGLPYEVASIDEVIDFLKQREFALEKVKPGGEGGNSVYLFSKREFSESVNKLA